MVRSLAEAPPVQAVPPVLRPPYLHQPVPEQVRDRLPIPASGMAAEVILLIPARVPEAVRRPPQPARAVTPHLTCCSLCLAAASTPVPMEAATVQEVHRTDRMDHTGHMVPAADRAAAHPAATVPVQVLPAATVPVQAHPPAPVLPGASAPVPTAAPAPTETMKAQRYPETTPALTFPPWQICSERASHHRQPVFPPAGMTDATTEAC